MEISLINDTIEELENSDTTFANCQKLSCLYVIREFYHKQESSQVEQELSEILPQYRKYCAVKRDYQFDRVGNDVVMRSMSALCKEIQEFIQTLYSNTDSEEERKAIQAMLDLLYKKYAE